LVLFVFHIFNDRCSNFINNCIFQHPNIDFLIICNNKKSTIQAPSYVKIIYRDNIGYDFGGWSEGLLTNNLYQHYDNFIFVNSSVIGPFLPPDFTGNWTDIYLNGLQGNIKLFGSTINSLLDPLNNAHVQSYIFALDLETLQYLIDQEIFSTTNIAKTFKEAIWNKEVLMSRKIIENGWNIGSLFLLYHGVDFTFSTKQPQDYNIRFLGDVMHDGDFGYLWTEQQLVFVKGNRGLKFGPSRHRKHHHYKWIIFLSILAALAALMTIFYKRFTV
jgi:hypothetical protein